MFAAERRLLSITEHSLRMMMRVVMIMVVAISCNLKVVIMLPTLSPPKSRTALAPKFKCHSKDFIILCLFQCFSSVCRDSVSHLKCSFWWPPYNNTIIPSTLQWNAVKYIFKYANTLYQHCINIENPFVSKC